MAEAENPTPKQSIKFESATPLAADTKPPGQNTRQKPRRPPKPNYARIHAKPLPLEVFPLPAFVPHNPLSLLRIISTLINEWIQRPPSLPETTYQGYLSHETRSIHITDPKHARALWEMGFFGKGSLSRSEPTWLDRERARRKAGLGGTSEEATSKRREERRMFKLERARLEREAIEEQLRQEGKLAELRPETELAASKAGKAEQGRPMKPSRIPRGTMESSSKSVHASGRHTTPPKYDDAAAQPEDIGDPEDDAPLVDQEHLQLNLCEAFFLAYGLGVLSISADDGSTEENCKQDTLQPSDLLESFARHSVFPPCETDQIRPDNPFLLSYVVYHYYRSLGWVVRPGSKFACDWLLYNRGPVFSHAEFAVVIIPEYPDGQSNQRPRNTRDRSDRNDLSAVAQRKWWEMHCTNRVQSQVRKTLVLCYVQIPPTLELRTSLVSDKAIGAESRPDNGKIFKAYKVRDFVVRRWLANRSRD